MLDASQHWVNQRFVIASFVARGELKVSVEIEFKSTLPIDQQDPLIRAQHLLQKREMHFE